MCGVTGYFQPAGFSTVAAELTIREMSARLSHRGPDDEGAWLDADAGIALGHRRLCGSGFVPGGPATHDFCIRPVCGCLEWRDL